MRKLLVSAYGCEPDKGSEPGVGWFWILELAKNNQVWVVTRSNNKSSIENGLRSIEARLARNIHFAYYDCDGLARIVKRKAKGLYGYYFFWQIGAYLTAKQLHGKIGFDACIHLTFGSMWMPTWIYKLGIPFVWGPIGGGESVPSSLVKKLPFGARVSHFARQCLIKTAIVNPLFSGPAKNAKAILVRTNDSLKAIPKEFRHKTKVVLETGIGESQLEEYSNISFPRDDSLNVRLVFTGRLIAVKNVDMLLRAFSIALCAFDKIHLTIIGDGPLRGALETLARELDIDQRVDFLGHISQAEVIQSLKSSHIFAFPSLKEGGAWSLIEAFSVGLPAICLDASGMRVIADETCARLISVDGESTMTQMMSKAILDLAQNGELREVMGAAAKRRMRDSFSWNSKGRFMDDVLSSLS